MHHTETTHINTTFVFVFFNRREFTSKQQEEDWAKRLLATKENQRQLCKILYHLLLLSFWCCLYIFQYIPLHCIVSSLCLPRSSLGVITLPFRMISPQACLASTTGLPSPWNYLFANDQEGNSTWLPLSLIVKPAVPATILPSPDAPSQASSRIVTGTDIIPLWKSWGSSALIWENQ